MKITVRTSFSSGSPPTSTFIRGLGFTHGWVFTVRANMGVHVDAHGHASHGRGFRGQIRVLRIKGGALPLFPHFQPILVE
jgi:hypothetical protein